MSALLEDHRARRSLLVSIACAALATLLFRTPNGAALVHAPFAAGLTLALAAAGALGEALVREENSGRIARTIGASARAASALIVASQWASEAREVWGAITVAVIWTDVRQGCSEERPLLPLAVGLAWAIAWSAVRPSDAVPRVAAVAAIAAFGVRSFRRD